MSYHGTYIDSHGHRQRLHVNSRAKCKTCRLPLGVGDCPDCLHFHEQMSEIARAVEAQFADKPSEEVPY